LQQIVRPNQTNQGNCQPEISRPNNAHAISGGSAVPANQTIVMLSLRRIGDDPAALQQAFEGFYRWDSIRAVFGALQGCAEILALVALLSVPPCRGQVPKEQVQSRGKL
jgi:hypothetical protein